MAVLKISELQALSVEEINKKLAELKIEVMKANSQIATGTIPKNPGQFRNNKKNIARILTALNQRKDNSDGAANQKYSKSKINGNLTDKKPTVADKDKIKLNESKKDKKSINAKSISKNSDKLTSISSAKKLGQ